MISKKQKKTGAALLLSASLLFPNTTALAAQPAITEWLSRTPFSLKTVPPSDSTETSDTNEAYTLFEISDETVSTEQTESETSASDAPLTESERETEPAVTPVSVVVPAAVPAYDLQNMLEAVTLSPYAGVVLTSLSLSWEQLEAELSYRISTYSSKWSLYLKDLSTGNIISINERPQEAASLIKLYVMGAVMEDIQTGTLQMTDSVKKLLNDMITVSDNSATNDLVRLLDPDRNHHKGLEKLNAFIAAQGFENTHAYNGLEDSSLWYSIETPNTTSTQNCGALLEQIYNGTWISHLASHKMEDLLLAQKVTYKIPSTIPSESTVANKTGETSDCENDAAIVYTPKGDYILCIMSCEVSSKSAAVSNLRDLSRLVYDHFANRKAL